MTRRPCASFLVTLALLVAGMPAWNGPAWGRSAETAEICICAPQHPFGDYSALVRAAGPFFGRVLGDARPVRVRLFRNPDDLVSYLKSARPTLAFLDASLARVAATCQLSPLLGALVDGSGVRRRVVVERAAGAKNDLLAVPGRVEGAALASLLGGRAIHATSDVSALYAVRLGIASRAAVNWSSLEKASRLDPLLSRDFFRVKATLPEEANAQLFVSPSRLSQEDRETLVARLVHPGPDLLPLLGALGVDGFLPLGAGSATPSSPRVTTLFDSASATLVVRIPASALGLGAGVAPTHATARVAFMGGPAPGTQARVRPLNDGGLMLEVANAPLPGKPLSFRHVVAPGETLAQIAAQLLGDWSLYRDLARDNGIANPHAIAPGRVIVVKTRGSVVSARVTVQLDLAGTTPRTVTFMARYSR